jgi:hypothetical protein
MEADEVEATPKRGGTLTYMIPADTPPSLDGHREGTFAMLQALAPASDAVGCSHNDPAPALQ